MKKTLTASALLIAATAALAHTGVKDPHVMARMEGMKRMADSAKSVGLILRGEAPFEPATIAKAGAVLQAEAENIPTLFRTPADDPKSEARPAIWENWADFQARSAEGAAAAAALVTVSSPEDLRAAFAQVGETCKSCHELYRE